jgi:enamine deaminase RidA (YjgF/YER057c/UK114 family)
MEAAVRVQHLNPDSLHKNTAFTQVIAVDGPAKTVFVGGQDSVDAAGQVVGKGDIGRQTEQILANMRAALASAGAGLEHVVKWNLYVVQGQSLQAGFAAFQQVWGRRPNPPTIPMAFVSGLAHPDFLAEIDAIAVVPPQETAGARDRALEGS